MSTFSPQHIGAGPSPRNRTTPSSRGYSIPPGPIITTSTFSPQYIGAGSSTRNSTTPSPRGHRIPPGPRLSNIPLPAMTPTTMPAILGHSARSLEPLSPPPYEQVMASDQNNQQRTPHSRRASVDQHASSSGRGLGFEAASQPSQSPSTLSPLRNFVPSPQAPRRSPVYESRSPSPMPTNTQRPLATSSRAAPSLGYNAAPTHRAAAPHSPPPEVLNARQQRRRAGLARQQLSGPSIPQRVPLGRDVAQAYPPASIQTDMSSSPAVRRHSIQPTARPKRASHTSAQALASGSAVHHPNPPMDFMGPPGSVQAYVHVVPPHTASAPVARLATHGAPLAPAYDTAPVSCAHTPAPAQRLASAPFETIAAKRVRDAERVQKCERRVRRRQEKAEDAARRADREWRGVTSAKRELDEAYAMLRAGSIVTEGVASCSGAIAQDGQVASSSTSASLRRDMSDTGDSARPSFFEAINAINGQPGEFFEALAEVFGISREVYLHNPMIVFRTVMRAKRAEQWRAEGHHRGWTAIGEPGPSSVPLRNHRTAVASPKTRLGSPYNGVESRLVSP